MHLQLNKEHVSELELSLELKMLLQFIYHVMFNLTYLTEHGNSSGYNAVHLIMASEALLRIHNT